MKPYEVEFGPAAVRAFKKLPPDARQKVRVALEKLSANVAQPGRIGGKSTKTIRGTADSLHRLRVGDYRVMYDVMEKDKAVLILGIVHRGDLERWLRNR